MTAEKEKPIAQSVAEQIVISELERVAAFSTVALDERHVRRQRECSPPGVAETLDAQTWDAWHPVDVRLLGRRLPAREEGPTERLAYRQGEAHDCTPYAKWFNSQADRIASGLRSEHSFSMNRNGLLRGASSVKWPVR